MNRFVNPSSGPSPAGPYSTAVITENGFLFISGQLSLDRSTGNITGDTVSLQTETIIINILSIVKECSFSTEDIIKITIYITDMGKFPELNGVYSKYFDSHKPVRTTVEVKGLPKGALVEIEAVCCRAQGKYAS